MKKLLTGMMALGMLGSVTTALPSIAANGTTSSATISYTAAESYEISIPDSVSLSDGSKGTMTLKTVKDKAIRIPYGQKLTYKVDSGSVTLNLEGDNSSTAKVVLKKDQKEVQSDTVLFESEAKLAADATTSEDITVECAKSNAPLYSGTYKGTITFNISVE